ncbi:MAG: hypothetical protein JRI72_14525 [Deltaproteobacteria bacterium]|nr:hypothetical protein [Deltaproteobacteria bacterium]
MLTRDTHARIYQGDLSKGEYDELQSLARQKNISVRDLLLDAIRAYLKNGKLRFSLNIEEVLLNTASVRFYLWLPYEIRDELDQFIKSRGTYIQEFIKKAIKNYSKNEPEDIAK